MEVKLNVRLGNNNSIVLGLEGGGPIKDDTGKEIGSVIPTFGAVRFKIEDQFYDVAYTDIWDAIVNTIGKKEYCFKKS